jgi:hypothetical protein
MLLLSAPSALASEGCPNEAVRTESNINPTTHEPYDVGLPECRAYEMVSPLEKQQHDAIERLQPVRTSVAPEGNAVGWSGQGDYAGAENYQARDAHPNNPYVAQRTTSGWVTRSGYPPITLVENPFTASQASGVYSSDLADETVCGTAASAGENEGPTIRCVLREPDGSWVATPEYTDLTGETFAGALMLGASSNGQDVLFYNDCGIAFLSSDTSRETGCAFQSGVHQGGIYEEVGVGTSSPELRLVNVDSSGVMIGPESESLLGAEPEREEGPSAYQAMSSDGTKIFFTATPSGGVPTIYARIDGDETVAISGPSPSECSTCDTTPEKAVYQGASADGSKVFFTTTQQLLNSDTDSTSDLYEYDFKNPSAHRLVQVSGGGLGDVTPGAGAEVQGVVNVSQDGSHVYFVARGVLTTLPNGLGQTASAGSDNLYAYNTNTGETRFVASLLESDGRLWGRLEQTSSLSGDNEVRLAQSTPDGSYLVFASYAELITTGPEADTSGAQQVYRYDFQTGKIIRVSTGHEGFADNGNVPGFNAIIGPADDGKEAALPTVNDSNRAISESGETIVFITAAQLESTDVAGGTNNVCDESIDDAAGAGCEVYVWHNGSVNMISDGQEPSGTVYAGMSATGSDIFFETRSQLVGQDTDSLGDIYDARVDGGFPAPTPEPSCSGEACQGTQSSAPTSGAPGSQSFTGGGNQTAPPFTEVLEPETKPKSKPRTRAQKLARALEVCRRRAKSKVKRAQCKRTASLRYGPRKHKGAKKG